jgi:hypothetical protein
MRGLAQLNHGKPKTIHVSSAIRPKVALPTRAPDLPDAKFTACEASEVAFSTGHGGAMTLAFLEAFAEREADTTLPALHKAIRQRLPSIDWAQTPQFSCDSALRKRTLRSFMRGAA